MEEFCDSLMAPVSVPVPVASWSSTRAIAVLPFVNASADPENEYFSDGMTDELINALVKVEGLQVASRASVFALKNQQLDTQTIGQRLNVSTLLEGSVRKAANRLRITVQLSSVTDGRTLWSDRYDREMADIFVIQDEIAQHIVQTLRASFLGDLGDPTPVRYRANMRAYSLYLKGRFWWNRRTQADTARAVKYFEDAIAEDPDYALAYTGLADSYALEIDYSGAPVKAGLERAKVEARKAIQLDDTLAEAHTSLGWVTFIYDWNWVEAEREFTRAIELNPRYSTARQWRAWFLRAMGRMEEALAEARAAVELDPASVSIRRSLGWLQYYAGQYDASLENLRRALAMDPTAEETLRLLGLVYMARGMYPDARAAFNEAIALSPSHAMAVAGLGQVAAREGRLDQAREYLDQILDRARHRYVSPVALIKLYAAMGDVDAGIEWLEQAYKERRGYLAYLKIEPELDPLRSDARFNRLLERMRLT
jgi:TolB-like protein/tetratricopeptide (TPR) repeat protein